MYNFKNKNDDFKKSIDELEKQIDIVQKELDEELERSYKDNTKLHNENEKLKRENEKLKRLLNMKTKVNSQNSSLAPSADVFKAPKNSREKSERKVGGQLNHKGNFIKCSDKVDTIIEKRVIKAPTGAEAVMEDGVIVYYRTQEKHLNITTSIIETRYYISDTNEDDIQKENELYKISPVTYSNQTKAMVLYLHSKGIIALQRLCEIIEELSAGEMRITASSIVNWQREFYKKVKKKEMLY